MLAPRTACLTIALLLTASVDLLAQEGPPVAPGDRVRVRAPAIEPDRIVGTVVETGADTCVLAVQDRADTLALPFASLTSLEVSQGMRSHVALGAGVGMLGGFLLGFGVGVMACEGFTEDCLDGTSGAKFALFTGAIGGLGGLVLGAALGAVARTDRWEEVPLDRLQVSIVPQRAGGLVVSASIRL